MADLMLRSVALSFRAAISSKPPPPTTCYRRTIVQRRILFVCICVLVIQAMIGARMLERAMHLTRRPLNDDLRTMAETTAKDYGADLETVQILSSDGVSLRGWLFRKRESNGSLVLLLHGQGDNRAGMLKYASLFLRNHYGVLSPDARAHGESGGGLATYGVTESEDVAQWVSWLAENEKPQCVFGFGESMGAAIVLQSLRTEPGFCAVVAESAFYSFREIAYDRAGRVLGGGETLGRTLLRPGVEAGFLYARVRYGIDFDSAEPARAVATSRVPLLLIHGLEDISIPPRHSRMIRESRPPGTELWEAKATGHTATLGQRPEEFERRATGFLAEHSLNDRRVAD